ncbi:hypothetical protein [Streptomyces mirabilis]|uniref:hypothetical protein n=1 Tax=Streptomyces mirabilis TaxID=68239 RepID=UPI003830E748
MSMRLPWYARLAATIGRPVVLLAALAMSAPGEYNLARLAGWSPDVAALMPVTLSVYAAVAAVIAATRPKGVTGRVSALVGAGMALSLALAAQVTAHLIARGYMGTSAFLVAATSAVPPVVVAHLLHLAAVPRAAPECPADSGADTVTGEPVCAPQMAAVSLPAVADNWPPDDLWADFANAEADSAPDALPPTPDVIRAAVEALSADGRKVTGPMLGDHFGVSARTGRRYLAMAA